MQRLRFITGFLLIAFSIQAQPKIENNQLVLDNPVTFKAGTSELTDEAKTELQLVRQFLTDKAYISLLRIEGHSDNDGNEADLQKLTEQRAMSVCRWLVANGIDCKRLIAVGFGSTKPVESNSTPEGKARNRRITFVIASLRGKLIGGMPAEGGGKVGGEACEQ